MEREPWTSSAAIREEVYEGLRLGKYIDRHRSVPVCQYLVLPAFENPVSWDVIRVVSRTAGQGTRLYCSCWRMDVDNRAMSSPVERLKYPRPFRPTVEVDWAGRAGRGRVAGRSPPFDSRAAGGRPAALWVRWSEFRAIRRRVLLQRPHRLVVPDLPDEWHELRPVIAEVVELFERAWAARADKAAPDRGRHPGFARHEGLAGGPGG